MEKRTYTISEKDFDEILRIAVMGASGMLTKEEFTKLPDMFPEDIGDKLIAAIGACIMLKKENDFINLLKKFIKDN